MHNFERHALILSMLQAQGHATIEAMAEACATSLQTIRRDLNTLVDSGRVERFHGGARLPQEPQAISYDAQSNLGPKETAANLLLALVPDNASLFISGGSTLAIAATVLRQRDDLTVITNNLHAAVALFDRKGIELHVVGGLSRAASASITGERAVEFIERFKVDIAIVGTSGIDLDGTLLEYDQAIVTAMRSMLANSRKKILVADASKFKGGGVVRGAYLGDFDAFVCDVEPPASILSILKHHNVDLYCAATAGMGHKRGAASTKTIIDAGA